MKHMMPLLLAAALFGAGSAEAAYTLHIDGRDDQSIEADLMLPLRAPAEALGGEGADFQLGLVAFSLLYGPVGVVLGVAVNGWSRRCEYEADAYAAEHYSGALLASGLKKISVKALSNLTPHPWYERVYYSHPSLLKRLERLTINDEGLMINEKIL